MLMYFKLFMIVVSFVFSLFRELFIFIIFNVNKGLKVNAGKSKVMVGSSGGKMIVNSGK